MRVISLDASSWSSRADVMNSIAESLGVDEGIGRSLDGLLEVMFWSPAYLGAFSQPYVIKISGTTDLPKELTDYVRNLKGFVDFTRQAYRERHKQDIDVSIETDLPPLEAG